MSIFKRAFLYVTRKRGKTVLLFAILLIMATLVLTGLSIWKLILPMHGWNLSYQGFQ